MQRPRRGVHSSSCSNEEAGRPFDSVGDGSVLIIVLWYYVVQAKEMQNGVQTVFSSTIVLLTYYKRFRYMSNCVVFGVRTLLLGLGQINEKHIYEPVKKMSLFLLLVDILLPSFFFPPPSLSLIGTRAQLEPNRARNESAGRFTRRGNLQNKLCASTFISTFAGSKGSTLVVASQPISLS